MRPGTISIILCASFGLLSLSGATEHAFAQVPRFEKTPAQALLGLKALDVTTRRNAVARLANMRTTNAVEQALAAALFSDPDLVVRQNAAHTLAKSGRGSLKPVLAQAAICDPAPSIRTTLASWAKRVKVLCHKQSPPHDTEAELPAQETQLLLFLSHPSAITRQAAARRLAQLKSKAGYNKMWQMTAQDPVWTTRASFLRILARVYGRRLLPALHYTLTKDPDARVREVALEALSFIKAASTVSWILASVQVEQIPAMQKRGIRTIKLIGGRQAANALAVIGQSSLPEEIRLEALAALTALPGQTKAHQDLFSRLLRSDRSVKIRATAFRALGQNTSTQACTARVEIMRTAEPEIRLAAIEQLAKCSAKIARPALMTAAREDKEPKARRLALELLIKAGPTKAKEVLAHVLSRDEKTELRMLALQGALKLPNKDRLPLLRLCVKNDPEVALRQQAIQALDGATDPSTRDVLISVLENDRQPEIRAAAARALAKGKDSLSFAVLQRSGSKDSSAEVRQAALQAAARSPARKAWMNSKLPRLIDAKLEVRLGAINDLCPLPVPRILRALLLILWTDASPTARSAVARCFADRDHPLVDIGLSVTHSTDTDGEVIRTAEIAQKQRQDKLQQILTQSKSSRADDRLAAAKKMPLSPNKKSRAIIDLFLRKDQDPRVRQAAVQLQARYQDQRALQLLMQAGQVDQDPGNRELASSLYGKLQARWSAARQAMNIHQLITTLKSGNLAGRIKAAQLLGILRDQRAINPLKEAAKENAPPLRYAALLALTISGEKTMITEAAKSEKDREVKDQLIQLNYLINEAPEKMIAALSSTKDDEILRGIEAAAIKLEVKAIPWLVKVALSHVEKETRLAAGRSLALYQHPLASWALRVAASHDASKQVREAMWPYAVISETKHP